MEILKVSSKSDVNKTAGMIAYLINEGKKIEIQVIGAGALSQAIKSIIVARGYVAPSGINLSCIPAFTEIEIQGELKTAIKLIIVV